VGLLGLLVAGGFASEATAGGALQSAVTPASTVQGDTVTVRVSVDTLTPALGCFNFTLDYDPAQLRFVDAVEGASFAGVTDPTFFSVALDSQGREVVSDCVLGYGTSVPTPGEIAVLRFETLSDGLLASSYTDVILRDVDRATIVPVSVDTVAVMVGATGVSPLPASALRLVASPNPSASVSRLGVYEVDGGSTRVLRRAVASGLDLKIYDVAGHMVRSLRMPAGTASAVWDGRDADGTKVAGGVYFGVVSWRGSELRAKILRLNG